MSKKRFRFEKECTKDFFTEKGVFYNNERPMGANEIIGLLNSLSEENEQLHYELQQTKEYLQTKIDECKNYKKMKEIVFGVEQAVGYEKALLQFQKGLKRRLNNE